MKKKVGINVIEASEYLKDVIYLPPQQIRMLARRGECPFCLAIENSNGHWTYFIHKEKLLAYKKGNLRLKNAS